jgi:hypothetical protein
VRFLALAVASFSTLIPAITFASQTPASAESPETQASIEIFDSEVEKASESVDEIIQESKGTVLRKTRIFDNEMNQRKIFRYLVRFKASIAEKALSKIRSLGTVTRETANFEINRETIDIAIELTDSRRRRQPARSAQLFAGATAAMVNLNLSNDFNRSMLGAGISLTPSGKWAYLTVLSFRDNTERTGSNDNNAQAASASGSTMLLIGHNYYSSIFGNGENTFFNPFAGVNYGIARLYTRTMFAFGGTLGVELVSSRWFTLSAAAKLSGLYSSKDGGTASIYLAQISLPF